MKSDVEHRIIRAMNAAMRAQGWPSLSLCDLPLCYAKNTPVTPYFLCSEVPLRPYGKYTIDGAIGVIHQGFETLWMQNPDRKPVQPGFAVLLNVLNVPDLHDKRLIPPDGPVEASVDSFCVAVANLLNRMPHDERELVAAHEKDELCGFRLNAFSGYAYRTKFHAFREFVAGISKDKPNP